MMNHIDLSSVLRQTVACDLSANLVTRPTGAAVRHQIERLLDDASDRTLTVIDFSQVSMIDFSCADEVVAKLLIRYSSDTAPRDAYFLFRGVTDIIATRSRSSWSDTASRSSSSRATTWK